jgi:hypothetical protein
MSQAFVRITSTYGKFARKKYGPFPSEEDAKTFLRERGWSENINGEKGLWYVQSGRYEGTNAKVETLDDPETCPGHCGQKTATK